MTDYARVAEELREYYNDPVSVPDKRGALRIAAALCDAYAQPVDEAKERALYAAYVQTLPPHLRVAYSTALCSEGLDVWLARARSDARAKVAEAALESIRDEVLNADANVLNNDQVNYVLGIIDAYIPPSTVEGEQK